ncbi:MAG: hypothetical protein IH965_14050 [Gemmatimonadetes bacterium]|nr:hypothetical protein [Gemmatimonadota bacterium]
MAQLFLMDPSTFYRMRCRLMPDVPSPGRTDNEQELDLVLLAFAKRCRLPQRRTDKVLRRAHA